MKTRQPGIKALPTSLTALALCSSLAFAQAPDTPPADVPPADKPAADVPPAERPPAPALLGDAAAADEANAPAEEMVDGMRLTNAPINGIFTLLAQKAGLSYFHNNRLQGEEFNVSGYLKDDDPLTQMEGLAFNNALTLHRKGNTVYALTTDQLSQLPAQEWTYQLRYLRSKNMKEHMKELITPLLSPNTGIVNYEEKTNTLIIIDTPDRVERAKNLLERIDRAKGQIVVEFKILRVNSSVAQNIGVDWSSSLGADGGIAAVAGINSLLGINDARSALAEAGDIVFAPDEIVGVIRALNDAGITKLENNPTVITEDNEASSISIIDRVPIITTETTQSSSGDNPTVTEEVRYKIDESDSTEPETTREIGTTIFVTPTLLPDNTIRLNMRPRTASITKNVESATGNIYPEVRESTITTIARIPNGHSLVVGGFFQEIERETENKVPLLGDIPGIRFLFKSKSTEKSTSSLIFIVTPKSYEPADHSSHHRAHNRISSNLQLPCDHDELSKEFPGRLHESDLKRTLHNIGHESGLLKHPETSQPQRASTSSDNTSTSTSSESRRFRLRR